MQIGIGIIVIPVITVYIIFRQLSIRTEAMNTLEAIGDYLPNSTQGEYYSYNTLEEKDERDGEENGVLQIGIWENEVGWLPQPTIIDNLNKYLAQHQNVAPNFEIVRDIIERGSSTLDDRLRTLLPLPLYLGLVGTILGIIVGLVEMSLRGTNLQDGVSSLVAGVALAMCASLVGIILTVSLNQSYKNASSEHEVAKERFYNWFLTEMLPTMSSSASGPMGQLIRSLSSFNKSFSKSANIIGETSGQIAQTFTQQALLLSSLERFTTGGALEALVRMGQEMTQHSQILQRYTQSVNAIIAHSDELKGFSLQLASHGEYVQAIKQLNETLATERNSIEETSKGIRIVYQVAVNELAKQSNQNIESLIEQSRSNLEHLQASLAKQVDDLDNKLETHLSKPLGEALGRLASLPESIDRLHDAIASSTSPATVSTKSEPNNAALTQELRNLSERIVRLSTILLEREHPALRKRSWLRRLWDKITLRKHTDGEEQG